MDLVELSVLGPFRLQSGGRALADAVTDKARALLTFLALEGAQPRTALAALLWPYLPQETAFDHLRKTLYRLRQRLEENSPAADLLIANRQQVQLDAGRLLVDARRFQTLLAACDQHPHRALALCDECLARLTEAVELYQGELLSGFVLDDAPAFEEWLVLRRETLQHQLLLTLGELTLAWEDRGEMARAHAYCSRSLAIDPLREETQRQQMRLLVRMGQRNQALQQYEALRRLLREELGVEPDPATTALYEQIRHGDTQPPVMPQVAVVHAPPPPIAAAPIQTTNSPKWADVPHTGRVYGRTAELAQMAHWLSAERCQLVAILGIGGVGKTTLAAASASAVAGDFDKVIWRSLLNAPPLDELLRGVLLAVVAQPLVDLPLRLDDQLTLLLNELRRQRCLLVLDNLESILQPEGIGQMSPGYEGYSQLIRRLAENRHNSTLLLTSRERVQGMARWEEDLPWVHSLQLEGLDASAGQAILSARGLGGQTVDGDTLVQRYSGHPLALKLVTETIQELFEGNIGAFLASDVVIFDDIRRVLDEQFARLSDLERDILIWLAIEREAITVPILRDNLLHFSASRSVLEAVRSLQQRSLLETSGAGVTLQNVIIEYTTAYLVEQMSQEIERGGARAWGEREGFAFSALATSCLNRFALLKTQAKEYVRQSQARLILQPLAERLLQRLGERSLKATLRDLLESLRTEIAQAPGYAGGNLLNLVRQLGFDLAEYDFSRLSVWQADFRELMFTPINLAHADLSQSVFTLPFELSAIRFSASGEVVVTGVVDSAICLWRTAGGQLHHAFRSMEIDGSRAVSFSQDGQWLVSSGSDHAVYLWSAENGALLHTFAGHTDRLSALAISRDGRLIASSSRDDTIRIWDVERGQLRHTLVAHADAINALAFHPDGRSLAGGGGERVVCLWDTETGQLTQTLNGHQREIECLTFASDGKVLVSGAHDGAICLWDVASGQCQRTLEGHRQIVRTLLLHSDDRLLASGGADRLVRLWDLQSGELLYTFVGHSNEVKSLSFRADGLVLASGAADNVVQLWDTHTGHKLDSLKGHADMVRSVRFHPSGNLLASGGADGLVRLWHLGPTEDSGGSRGRVVKYLQGHVEEIRVVAFHPHGRLLASEGRDHLVHLWDVESGKPIHLLRGHTNTIKALAFSADGRWLASGGTDRTIRLWPIADASVVNGQGGLVLHGHDDEISALAFSPDGRTLVSSSLDHTARLWAINSGRELHVLRGHPYALSSVAFSPDGEFVVTSGYDYSPIVWDAQSGQRSDRWRDQAVSALLVVFHPNGELFASITAAQTIEIRRVATGALLHTLVGHTQPILSLEFSPTDPILVSSGWGNVIRLWNTESGDALESLRSPGPYASMNITGVTGITDTQKAALKALGAYEQSVDEEIVKHPIAPTRR